MWIVKAHLLSTLAMMGIIWFVQLNHYPLFHEIKANFTNYEAEHVRRTSYVIMPLMLLEFVTAFLLINRQPGWFWISNFILLLLIWGSTFFIQVPLHNSLQGNYNEKTVNQLINSNWVRTILWTIRSISLLIMIKL